MERLHINILNDINNSDVETFLMEFPIDKLKKYLRIAMKHKKQLGNLYRENKKDINFIYGMIIYIREHDLDMSRVFTINKEILQDIAIEFYSLIVKNEKLEKKKEKIKILKQQKNEKKRAKKNVKIQAEKEKKRKNNKFCKNETEFFLIEDIEDIPTEDLTFIKFNNSIFCLDSSSYINMIKFSKDQKVRGACKPAIPNEPLVCENFYPINIGQNIFINEENYNKRYNESLNISTRKRKFSFVNKKVIDFTTGLHIISQKTGLDDVYDLVPDDYPTINPRKSVRKISHEIQGQIIKKNYTIAELKEICKEKGIKGFSKLKKLELIAHCSVTDATTEKKKKINKILKEKTLSVVELRKICKELKIKGYSRWGKAELLKNCKRS